jgi:hypothetical protein
MINLAIFFASLSTHRLSSAYLNLAFIFQGAQTGFDLYFQTDLLPYFISVSFCVSLLIYSQHNITRFTIGL